MEFLNNYNLAQNLSESIAIISTSYILIFMAEMGDKSQLVCMLLAARYRALPVLAGSFLAFFCLNILAVSFGAAAANWLPEVLIASIVCLLFGFFGWQSFTHIDNSAEEAHDIPIKTNRNVFFTTFFLILIAELGDKTQLAVVALSSANLSLAVFMGATAALFSTSALGVWAGRTILPKLSMRSVHQISGILFIILALFSAFKVVTYFIHF